MRRRRKRSGVKEFGVDRGDRYDHTLYVVALLGVVQVGEVLIAWGRYSDSKENKEISGRRGVHRIRGGPWQHSGDSMDR